MDGTMRSPMVMISSGFCSSRPGTLKASKAAKAVPPAGLSERT